MLAHQRRCLVLGAILSYLVACSGRCSCSTSVAKQVTSKTANQQIIGAVNQTGANHSHRNEADDSNQMQTAATIQTELQISGGTDGAESGSPSIVSSLYNYISQHHKAPQDSKDSPSDDPSANSKLPSGHEQSATAPTLEGRAPKVHKDQKVAAVALGGENEPLAANRQFQLLAGGPESFSSPLMVVGSGGHSLAAASSSIMAELPPMLQQQLAMQSNAGPMGQVLANFYMNGGGLSAGRQMAEVGSGQDMDYVGPFAPQYTSSASQSFGASQPISYGEQQQQLQNYHHYVDQGGPPGFSQPLIVGPAAQFRRPAQAANLGAGPAAATNDRKSLKKRTGSKQGGSGAKPFVKARRSRGKENLLSNDQLVSLIDELKEFNSRQASKIQTNLVAPTSGTVSRPMGQKSLKSERKNKDTSGSISSIEREIERQKAMNNEKGNNDAEGNEDDQLQQGKMDTDDLAKFARFLMTKEGSNLKFQLGLDKDSPDDGDEEDDRDALLESKEKRLRAKPKAAAETTEAAKELEDLDRKHSKVANQMDLLIDGASEKAKVAAGAQRSARGGGRKGEKSRRLATTAETNEGDEVEKARRRRDHGTILKEEPKIKEVATDVTVIEPNPDKKKFDGLERGHDENFAKMLIRQELLEDRQEAAQDDASASSPNTNDGNKKEVAAADFKVHKYSKDGRNNKNHAAIVRELRRARSAQSNVRSRAPVPNESLLRRALEGDMAVRVERSPEGTLLVRTNGDRAILALDLAKKEQLGSRRFNQPGGANLAAASSVGDDNDGSTVDSEPIPSQEERTPSSSPPPHSQIIDKVKIQSPQQLKDEYPISEKVSDRLNKLSSNLDRYFNDGFMKEIETKSKVGGIAEAKTAAAAAAELHQPQPSNIDQASQTTAGVGDGVGSKHGQVGEGLGVDRDFDVNVGIDGKTDIDRDDDGDEDESREKKGDEGDDEGDEKDKGRLPVENFHRKKPSSRAQRTSNNKRRTGVQGNGIRPAHRRIGTWRQPSDMSHGSKATTGLMRRNESIKNENLEFENHQGQPMPNLDPVESESLETPIGPDMLSDTPNLASAKRTQSSKQRNRSASYGKRVNGKFYEEPEW